MQCLVEKVLSSVFCLLFSVFAIGLLVAVPAYAEDAVAALKQAGQYDAQLSSDFLRSPKLRTAQPSLKVKHYDTDKGLLAGYKTANGKRILFRASKLPNGTILAAAFHWDERSQSVKPLMAPAWGFDPSTGKKTINMQISGVDVRHVLRQKALNNAPGQALQRL